MINWIETVGPPLCGLAHVVREWGGSEASSIDQEQTDYSRACNVANYIEVIACGAGQALLLGDEPLPSAFHSVDNTLFIVRWWSCESDDRAEAALHRIPSRLPSLQGVVPFEARAASLVMFDAARSGSHYLEDYRTVDLEVGSYVVTSERYEVDGAFDFLIHRFLRR